MENISKILDKTDWTLKNDIELKDVLQNFGKNMMKNMNEMEMINNNLDKKLSEMQIRIQHVHNRINCTKTERFIEEKVDDIGNIILAQKREQTDKKKKEEIPQKECEQRTIRAISNAILKSFEILKMIGQEELETLDPIDPTSNSNSSTSIQRKQFANKLLSFDVPPIIGTNEFNLFLKEKMKRIELKEQQIKSIERQNLTKSHEEGDVGSISSNRSIPPQDPIVMEKTENPLLEEIVGKMTKKNLFKSKSSISEEEDKMEENEAKQLEKEQFMKNNAIQENRREKDEKQQKQIDESTILSGSKKSPEAIEEEMSKPVFKTFDSAFSDRLATALKHGPISLRSADRPAAVHRPFSAQSIPSSGDEPFEFEGMQRTLRKTESSISSNEEFGPATVKARIAQIGSKIPMAHSSAGDVGENESKKMVKNIENEQKEAPMPTEQTDALKNRVRGPARRAPTKMAKSNTQIEPQKMVTLPPPPPPKQKGRSIFSSSSSEDDLAKLKNDLQLPKRKQQPLLPTKNTEIRTQIITAKKDTIGKKKQRGLFDDTDSDF